MLSRIDDDLFYNWEKTVLMPELKTNQVLIIDNATYHHKSEFKELFENTVIMSCIDRLTLLNLTPSNLLEQMSKNISEN